MIPTKLAATDHEQDCNRSGNADRGWRSGRLAGSVREFARGYCNRLTVLVVLAKFLRCPTI